jgi:NAD(P)-dependent dehydrogenase (short-subunit alcohol dehydrogenase family)
MPTRTDEILDQVLRAINDLQGVTMSHQRIAVVTGSSSGFGKLTVEALAADGWRVFVTLRNLETVNATAADALRGVGAEVVELDVLSDASVDVAAAAILAAGTPDVLVNNAGVASFGLIEAFTPAAVERQFATNVFGPLRVSRAFLPAMRTRGSGLVVYVSSVAGRLALPFYGAYAASKWALEALAETSSYALAPSGVDVAIVEPGDYPTNAFARMTVADDDARTATYGDLAARLSDVMSAAHADPETLDPADVARAVVRLANAPARTRPLRTTVPANPAADAVNAATAQVQAAVIAAFGLGDLGSSPMPPRAQGKNS